MQHIKICRFVTGSSSKPQIGIVANSMVYTLKELLPNDAYTANMDNWTVEEMIPSWPELHPRLKPRKTGRNLDAVTLVSSLSNYGREVFCVGKNYLDHVKEMAQSSTMNALTTAAPSHPIIFTKTRTSIPLHPIIKASPSLTTQLDYEAEFGVVIAKPCRNVASSEQAWQCIFGYTLLNDVTARDLQKQHGQWVLGKSCDSFCPVGPWIVPVSHLPSPQVVLDWTLSCHVNDELRQQGSVRQMIHDIPSLIRVISKSITLLPGDLIASGTPAGVGAGFKPEKFLKNGDTITIHSPAIGTLKQTVEIAADLAIAKL